MVLILLLVGFFTLLGQVTLLRELNVAFYGSELIYLLALGIWLLWTAAGAALGRRRFIPAARHVCFLFLLLAIALPALLAFVRGIRPLFAVVPGAYLSFPRQMLAMILALLPPGLLAGLLFQWTARRYIERGRTLARAYAIESAGAVLGGLAATLALRWELSNLSALLLASLGAALTALAWRRTRRGRIVQVAAAALTLLLLASLWQAPALDRRLSAWSHPKLLAMRDTPYGRVTVTERAGQVVVFENDALAFETESPSAEAFVHSAALQHADPRRVLILGGAAEGLVREMLKQHPRDLDCVELDSLAFATVRPHLPAATRRSLAATPLRLVFADPRAWLREAGRYDLILVGSSEPESGRANRYYTREFFQLCAEHLSDGGVLALRLRVSENFWTPQQLGRTASVTLALREVFPEQLILPGAGAVLLASRSRLLTDPVELVRRFSARKIEASLVSPAWLRYILSDDRVEGLRAELAATSVPVNSDLRPVCFSYTQMLWLANFFPALGRSAPGSLERRVEAGLLRWPIWVLVALLLVLLRFRAAPRRAALVGIAGLVGMVLESVLILNYQMRSGVLYQDIGLLLTLFMAGLALGSITLDVLARRRGPRGLSRGIGFALVLGFAAQSGLMAWAFRQAGAFGLVATGFLLLATGFFVAGVFAYASLFRVREQQAVVSPLYAADLIGGCLGSLLGSLLLAPALGLTLSTGIMALLALLAVLLV